MTAVASMDFAALLPATARLANVSSGEELDAAAIAAAVAERAGALASAGIGHGDRVVVGHADPIRYVIDLLACWQAGAIAVAVNPQLGSDERGIVKSATGAAVWLDAAAELPSLSGPPAQPLGLDEPALVLMTSGTTGQPKGIAHSIRSLLTRANLNIAAIGTDTLRESLCVLPVFFGHGLIGNVLTPLLAGGRVHLWQGPDMKALNRLAETLDQRAISFMSSVPSFWKIALRVSPRPRHMLDRIHVGSAPLSIEQWRAIAEWAGTDAVFNMLGMTETANWIGGGSLAEAAGRDGYVGSPWGGALAVLDEAGKIARSGRGEVLVRSPSMMLGYWNRPDLDEAAFVDGWLRTGDIGELAAGEQLTLVGRLKSEINRGGIKVQAEEIDMLLERHPDIIEACAFGIPDPVAGELVAAAVVLRNGAAFDEEGIKSWCRDRVRAEAVPSRLWRVDAIPRNDRGKVVRTTVRDRLSSR
ncbi:MAG: class I adenylate-forming enzyme family protein [Devosia sp.]